MKLCILQCLHNWLPIPRLVGELRLKLSEGNFSGCPSRVLTVVTVITQARSPPSDIHHRWKRAKQTYYPPCATVAHFRKCQVATFRDRGAHPQYFELRKKLSTFKHIRNGKERIKAGIKRLFSVQAPGSLQNQ